MWDIPYFLRFLSTVLHTLFLKEVRIHPIHAVLRPDEVSWSGCLHYGLRVQLSRFQDGVTHVDERWLSEEALHEVRRLVLQLGASLNVLV